MDGPLLASRGVTDHHRDNNNHHRHNCNQNRNRNHNSNHRQNYDNNGGDNRMRSQSPHRHHNQRRSSRSRSRSRDRQHREQRNDNPSTREPQSFHPKHSNNHNHNNRNRRNGASYTTNKVDPKLPNVNDDPRSSDPSKRISHKALSQTKGRNTESFHAESTFVRPDLRVQIGSPNIESYNKKLKHDDVVIVPELFGGEDDWSTYYKLVEEMREIQEREKMDHGDRDRDNNHRNGHKGRGGGGGGKSEWIPWHEGAHLISKKPDDSPTYQSIIKRLCTYFNIDTNKQIGTRFNWYRDSNDWKVRVRWSNNGQWAAHYFIFDACNFHVQ